MRPVILIALALALFPRLGPGAALAAADPWQICARAAAAAERAERMPPMLLHAVSLAESGRWHGERKAPVAWPWTIYAEGAGKFFPSKAGAIAAVERLRARGVRNIDVGCMQVNLHYHPDAFADLEGALDPAANAAYAARLLKSLRDSAGSWAHAVGQYHNSDWRGRGQPYWRKVYGLWNSEQRRIFAERRAARIRANLVAMARQRDARLAAR
jgi:hypothetical protein